MAKLDAAPPLDPIPSIVLTADKPLRADLQPVDAAASVTFDDWLVGQALLATGLAAKQVTRTYSGHHLYLYSPRLVNQAIREVVADVRSRNGSDRYRQRVVPSLSREEADDLGEGGGVLEHEEVAALVDVEGGAADP